MSLNLVQIALRANPLNPSTDAWIADETIRGEKVELFRQYDEGDHRANLTTEMRNILRIGTEGSLNEFNDNYCPTIIQTMQDRIKLNGVQSEADAANEWIDALLRANRFDALQIDVHEATIRDGNTFVLVDADPETREIRITHEPAFDGTNGMLALYETTNAQTPLLAVKVWTITGQTIADTTRINVYYPNRIERYIGGSEGGLLEYTADGREAMLPWTVNGLDSGEPLGVPVIHFKNRGASHSRYGLSEIENVIPLQDSLNRTLFSMVATAELTGFPIRLMIGDQFPAALTPGMALSEYIEGDAGQVAKPSSELDIAWLNAIRLETAKQGEIMPYIDQARWLRGEIFRITNTPDDDSSAVSASGESLKQREIKLLGKVRRFHVKNGNAWEDVVELAARLQRTFSAPGATRPPELGMVSAQWEEAELRNDTQVVNDALAQLNAGAIDQETYLELVAPVYGWDAAKIQTILQRTRLTTQGAAFNAQDVASMLEGIERAGQTDAIAQAGEVATEVSANGTVTA